MHRARTICHSEKTSETLVLVLLLAILAQRVNSSPGGMLEVGTTLVMPDHGVFVHVDVS